MIKQALKIAMINKMPKSNLDMNSPMSKTGFKIWDGLPSWSKGVIIVGGLAAVYFGVTATLNRIKNAEKNKKAREALEKINTEIKQLENKGLKQTYPDSQYNSWADSIAKQFSGCDWEQGIGWSGSGSKLYNICYRMENDLDFAKLLNAYGIRTYDQCGFYPFAGKFTGNLSQAVADELKEWEIFEINNLLAKRGIKYKFT
jgi:hypothetical protein